MCREIRDLRALESDLAVRRTSAVGRIRTDGIFEMQRNNDNATTASIVILRVEYAISKFPNHGPSFRAHPGKYSVALLPA